MPHPLALQLRFTRSEFQRGLAGLTNDDARRRFMPMNCISWYVGHLANQEQAYWVFLAQEKVVVKGLNDLVGFGNSQSGRFQNFPRNLHLFQRRKRSAAGKDGANLLFQFRSSVRVQGFPPISGLLPQHHILCLWC